MNKKGSWFWIFVFLVLAILILASGYLETRTKACEKIGYESFEYVQLNYITEDESRSWSRMQPCCINEWGAPQPVELDCNWIFWDCEVIRLV